MTANRLVRVRARSLFGFLSSSAAVWLCLVFLHGCSEATTFVEEHHANASTQSLVAQDDVVAQDWLESDDLEGLEEAVGQVVTVRGYVVRTGKPRNGHRYLNFEENDFFIFCPSSDVDEFEEGDPADLYRNKQIEVTGKIERYSGRLQLRLSSPEQIRILEEEGEPDSADFELRKVGRDAWMSPAGLLYSGRDPEGLTRLDHVKRHTRDIPSRAGSHGVFDGDELNAFALIDEAWKKAKEKEIEPDYRGDRAAYLVPMGRRVGYLGGRSGQSRGNPALDEILIVVDSETNRVITAYPK